MPLQASEVLSTFENTGAYLHGHFRLTSGLHSESYLQCARVLQYPRHAERLGRELAGALTVLTNSQPIGLVVSPAIGGLIIGHEVARALGTPFIFTERDASARMTLRRGFTVEPGQTAVVVEDVITTGGSTREVIEVLRELGANPIAAGSIVDRSNGKAELGIPRVALATLDVKTFEARACPMCAGGSPAVKPGSRQI